MNEFAVSGADARLKAASIVFWDFDGVIKDSLAVKSVGFERLFLPYGTEVAVRVRKHHEAHGGVSRFEKIPLYLGWAGEDVTAGRIHEFCARFSQLVRQAVIDSAWVPGVQEYLHAHHERQVFVLVTATPQEEIGQILISLGLGRCFREVHGAPTAKEAAVRDVLQRLQCPAERALVVGDSETDFKAAVANQVAFLLRRTSLNKALQKQYCGPMFDDLRNE